MTRTGTDVLPRTALLVEMLERNQRTLQTNLDGIDHEASLIPFMEGASHLNWLVGHLIGGRNSILKLLGADPLWDDDRGARYRGGQPAPGPDEVEPLAALWALFEASGPRLRRALEHATEGQLHAERERGGTTGELVEFLVWHECYHTGQSSIYRRLAGLERALP